MNDEKEKSKKRGGVILWSVIILLMISNGVTIWLWKTTKNEIITERIVTEKIIVERDNVTSDLLVLQKDFESIKAKDAAMQLEIDAKKERIAELIKEAKKHKGDAAIIAQLKRETETLREIMKGFVRTIDSLNTLNINLVAEKKTVIKQLGVEKEKQTTLIKEKE